MVAKALRADLVETKLREEALWLQGRSDVLAAQLVNCPLPGCETKYFLYNYVFSDATDNKAALEHKVRSSHPKHEQETIVVANARSTVA